jgi:hypothetical protein
MMIAHLSYLWPPVLGGLAVFLLFLPLVGAATPRASAAAAPTVVSLEFDDATPDQPQAQGILAAHGRHGVFFVNSGRIGLNAYMTLAQLQGLAAERGNEIGGAYGLNPTT